MNDEARTPEQMATEIRDRVDELNRHFREAAEAGLSVEIEAQRIVLADAELKAARVHLVGVFRLVRPEPRPKPEPPPKRGHH